MVDGFMPTGLVDDDQRPGRMMFRCGCGRCQGYDNDGSGRGCNSREAELIGWRLIDGEWNCPYCTGNTENLMKVFDQ